MIPQIFYQHHFPQGVSQRIKPPRMTAASGYGDVFSATCNVKVGVVADVLTHPELKPYTLNQTVLEPIWLPMVRDVGMHTDKGGICVIYCTRGIGTLSVAIRKGRKLDVDQIHLSVGVGAIFDDRMPHSFQTNGRTDLLVFNVKRKSK